MRIYSPDEQALQALRGSNIELLLDVPRDKLQSLTDAGEATNWVNSNVLAYSDVNIKYISVGNEIRPDYAEAQYIIPAMQNIQNAISAANLQGQIKVSTAIDTTLLDQNSYPPSNGKFTDSAVSYIQPIVNFLVSNGAPLLANVYPYFAYVGDKTNIPLEYALFTQQATNDAGYRNLFDAMLDSIYASLEKIGAPNLEIVVSESGWPSEGEDSGASAENAGAYYQNLIDHAKNNGTPMRPNGPIETYLFAMFDENQKTGAETERHFGLFRPDKSPKYQVNFN
ncbi:glucan endo-1,3-beta-glucosidase-like [Senna tora]|uniref:glucan endo-1,3-beta-D-glucosidase n=1 Tax=Senna tora TaxID=362788 RepID=A0A834TRX2_9FABA|nr:glucan endo-1,3-beta-glucosidase-like [Senna tora]